MLVFVEKMCQIRRNYSSQTTNLGVILFIKKVGRKKELKNHDKRRRRKRKKRRIMMSRIGRSKMRRF